VRTNLIIFVSELKTCRRGKSNNSAKVAIVRSQNVLKNIASVVRQEHLALINVIAVSVKILIIIIIKISYLKVSLNYILKAPSSDLALGFDLFDECLN